MAGTDFKGQADEQYNKTQETAEVRTGSFFSQSSTYYTKSIQHLQSIDTNLEKLLKDGISTSQANAKTQSDSEKNDKNKNRNQTVFKHNQKTPKSFSEGFDKALGNAFYNKNFQKEIDSAVVNFAKNLGVSVEDLPGRLGENVGTILTDTLKSTKLGGAIDSKIQKWQNDALNSFKTAYTSGVDRYWSSREPSDGQSKGGQIFDTLVSNAKDTAGDMASEKASEALKKGLSDAGETAGKMAKSGSNAGAAMSGLVSGAGKTLASFTKLTVAGFALDAVMDILGKSVLNVADKFGAMLSSTLNAANRDQVSRQKMAENAQKRLEADVKAIIEEPFTILKEAAQAVYDVWDNNLRTINATQGYSKEDLQTLMGNYAERLRGEGLSGYVGATDITENLTSVLKTGLSGDVAEEFAYLATILNAAIPTQDFFQYADTYASLAANAIRQGASEAEAIDYANQQLKLFASNVLYASRQISGGFTTGLQNASDLFASAVQIAQASRTGDPSQIAGVLTSVAAITGSIAPDLASSMTGAIVQAATGGNSSQIVALRSLAGVNASNTEFLRQLAENPQAIFSTLFRNLAQMQNMSDGAYMEVAEGLSDVFGISMDAFARIDFNYLAQAIESMNVNDSSLQENLALLASGETTTSAEELRMQQINEYLIDEGLSYVMDNEVARAIQQHMWDEQLANEIMETEFAVNLTGSSAEFLESIHSLLDTIITLLNPLMWVSKITQAFDTGQEAEGLQADIEQVLELGKVGSGNAESFYNLTTRGARLDLTKSYVELLGGTSAYEAAGANGLRNFMTSIPLIGDMMSTSDNINVWGVSGSGGAYSGGGGIPGVIGSMIANTVSSATSSILTSAGLTPGGPTSSYRWSTIGKSTYSALSGSGTASGTLVSSPYTSSAQTGEEVALQALRSNFSKFTDSEYLTNLIAEGGTYEDWMSSARNFGIGDMNTALESLGYTEQQLKDYYTSYTGLAGAQQEAERIQNEVLWQQNMEQYTIEIKDNSYALIELVTTTNATLDEIFKTSEKFYTDWVDYYINQVYFRSNFTSSDEQRIKRAEADDAKKAVNELAEILANGNKDLLDPTIQTNALLAKILLTVEAIMQQNNTAGNLSIPDSLSAMATGLFNYSST